eukprot:CAMPEP_0119045530 /NCGR_PEP_ID=MMETSP1177-20130426/40672_1 /TAXON_ID=2985 /ORGANISM="Ochromonas sp, Strain CCMP1899" /LENGTH=103 /DNA_ID=CAMNT_0007017497 /DNA_START=37 /DNA_END=345 /DNA_ORIENTATION=+
MKKSEAKSSSSRLDKDKDKKDKKKTQISAKEYEDISMLLDQRLTHMEDEDPNFKGCLWVELLAWYFREIEKDLEGAGALESRKKTISQVIRRLVKHDQVFFFA